MPLVVPDYSRQELKFVTHEVNYPIIIKWLKISKTNFKREYENRLVNNIYFDSHEYEAFKSNIYGNSSRLKIRLRWYGLDLLKNNYCLEIKFKRNVFGWKEKFMIKNLVLDDNWKLIIENIKKSLPLNIKLLFEKNQTPIIINQYEREYFKSFNKKLRLTIDKNQKVYDQRFSEYPNMSKKSFFHNHIVVEFKFKKNFRNLVDECISSFPLRLSRNSKYINSFRSVTGI